MSTISRDYKPAAPRTIFHANPILSRLSKVKERADSDAASYAGIAFKTCYFLLLTLAGMIAQVIVMGLMAGEPIWQTITVYEKFTLALTQKEALIVGGVLIAGFVCELLGIFIRRTIPVTGTLYAASQGYVISFLVFKVLKGYEYLGLEALLLTVAVIAVMSWLYSSGLVRGGKKFRTVLLTLLLSSILLGVLTFVGSLIPATREFVTAMLQNSAFVIAMDVIGIVIAALFLISDFAMIDTCVKESYPKHYEWAAAFGLVFTVIWLYLKILDLLMQLAGKDDKK